MQSMIYCLQGSAVGLFFSFCLMMVTGGGGCTPALVDATPSIKEQNSTFETVISITSATSLLVRTYAFMS